MPISSGALEWPVSYFRKPDKEGMEVADKGEGTPRDAKNSPQNYKWHSSFTNRENYLKWRKKMDRKDPLKTRRKKDDGCCGCFPSNKINTENEDARKGQPIENPREIIRRRRRQRCVLLACCTFLWLFILMAIFVSLFLHFTGGDSWITCKGNCQPSSSIQWKTNHSYTFDCCDLSNLTGEWPSLPDDDHPLGYLVSVITFCPTSARSCRELDYSRLINCNTLNSCGFFQPVNVCCLTGVVLVCWLLRELS